MTVILAIGAFQAFFFAIILLNRKPTFRANNILVIWLAIVCVHLIINYAEASGYYQQIPQLIGISSSFILLYGPFLYLYVRDFVDKNRKYDLLHFLPFLIYNLSLVNFYFISDYDQKMELIDDHHTLLVVLSILKYGSFIAYTILSLLLIQHGQNDIKNYYSNTQDVDLSWLKFLILSIILLLVFVAIVLVLDYWGLYSAGVDYEIFAFVGLSIWIFSLGYYGMKKVPVFSVFPSAAPTAKYSKTRIADQQAKEYEDRLSKLMEEEKPYLDKQLTLDKLANLLDLPGHHLSQIINNRFQKNFYEFVNTRRIMEMEKLLKDPSNKNLTLLGVAQNSGFSSKASFNRTFKNLTGSTPSKYFKDLEKE